MCKPSVGALKKYEAVQKDIGWLKIKKATQYLFVQQNLVDYLIAIASISTNAPIGNAAT